MAGVDTIPKITVGGPSVILVEPQLGENIGFSARAMMNGGLSDLRIVNPRDGWPNPKAITAAAGADGIIETARIFDSIADAIFDLNRVFAMTARPREMIKPVSTPFDAAAEIRTLIEDQVKVGVLFGPESKGLTNDDLALADTVVQVPLNPANSSMNLGHAVMILAYEWFQTRDNTPGRFLNEGRAEIASKKDLLIFFNRLEAELDACGFFHIEAKRPIMIRNIRNIYQRALLTEQELRTLHGILTSLLFRKAAGGDG